MDKVFYIIIIVFAVLCLTALIINICDLNRFVVRNYTVTSDRIKKPFKFVLLSDLHNKNYGNENEKILSAIRTAQPDFVICAGDMITAEPGAKNETAVKFMQKLAKEFDVYYGMGNHEYRAGLYPDKYGSMYQDYIDILKEANVIVLNNSHVDLDEFGIYISGLEIDKKYYKRFRVYPMDKEYIPSVLGEKKKEKFEILIAHNPDYSPQYSEYGADLSVSGHVHGGLIRLPFIGGIASPNVRFFPKYNGGMYRIGTSVSIVSCGLGTHTLPLRLFDPGELCVITCKNSE